MSRFQVELPVALAGSEWLLSAQRVAVWPRERMLVVADAHFGKAATFRARGVPVPRGTTLDNLARLDTLIQRHAPATLVFLGDLFHAREAHAQATIDAMAAWRRRHRALDVVLVEGNHDRAAGAPPDALDLRVVEEPWCVDGVALCHHPRLVDGAMVVAGHLHPCVRLYGGANDALRLPCFWLREAVALLPAYGDFTGGAPSLRAPGERVIAIADDRLVELPALPEPA